MHPSLEPSVKKELEKSLIAIIIFLVRHTQCIENLVLIHKNNGEIILCVDFRNMNKASDKYNYPIPPMEQILQKFAGDKMLSLLYGFSRYN